MALAQNNFSKEEKVLFDKLLLAFEDRLVMPSLVQTSNPDAADLERAGNSLRRIEPYIGISYEGLDQTSNFRGMTQLSVPVSVNIHRSSPLTMDGKEYRDALQEGYLRRAAETKLASDINQSILSAICSRGTVVVPRNNAASGFADLAECEATFSEFGIPDIDRIIALTSRDYNGLAADLANRQTLNQKPITAYEKAQVGMLAGFDTYKLDNGLYLEAANAVATISGANQFHTPKATELENPNDLNSGVRNVDNRQQTISITVASGTVKVGDAFTIANVFGVHHITKQPTPALKTFRVIRIVTGNGGTGTVEISPPIISGQGATRAELQYKNVSATPATGAAITFLNKRRAGINPFWVKGAVELVGGSLEIPTESGMHTMTASTTGGIQLRFSRQGDINDMSMKVRLDVFYGVAVLQPQMCGILLFGQA